LFVNLVGIEEIELTKISENYLDDDYIFNNISFKKEYLINTDDEDFHEGFHQIPFSIVIPEFLESSFMVEYKNKQKNFTNKGELFYLLIVYTKSIDD